MTQKLNRKGQQYTALQIRKQPSNLAKPKQDKPSSIDREELVYELVRVAQATAILFERPESIPSNFVSSFAYLLRIAADRVNIYVLEQIGDFASIDAEDAVYFLGKQLARQNGRRREEHELQNLAKGFRNAISDEEEK